MFANRFSAKTPAITTGLIAGTLIEGPNGWMPVENLRIGDAVQSYDGGLVRVLGLDRDWTATKHVSFAIHLPGGALDNCSDLMLLPGQHVMIDTLNDPNLPDAIVALLPAASLDGWFGARRVPLGKAVEVITPLFADDEAIYANSGTLLHCPGIRQNRSATSSDFFTQLDLVQSRQFLQRTYGAPAVHPLYRSVA